MDSEWMARNSRAGTFLLALVLHLISRRIPAANSFIPATNNLYQGPVQPCDTRGASLFCEAHRDDVV